MTVHPRQKFRNNHQRGSAILSGLHKGPRIVPDMIGANSIEIVAWEQWMQDSACLDSDPEIFYPEKGDRTSWKQAKRICDACPVQSDCLSYAVARHEAWGIWGGRTPNERRPVNLRGTA